MHIDLNSCFATIEQQANPHLRGKPIVVAAYTTDSGCILSPSIEAKRLGIKTGMRVFEAKLICPNITVKFPDPDKYRDVHKKFMSIFKEYSPDVVAKSIDEAVIDFTTYMPRKSEKAKERKREVTNNQISFSPFLPFSLSPLIKIAREIKSRLRREVGEWISASVGIGMNRFLAKLGASIQKPDGLVYIDSSNLLEIYRRIKLLDFCGINIRTQTRLAAYGITTPLQFFHADSHFLHKVVFKSIVGFHWHLEIRGFEVTRREYDRKSYGQQYSIKNKTDDPRELLSILYRLTEKMGRRLRRAKFMANGIHVGCMYVDRTYLHEGKSYQSAVYTTHDLFKRAKDIFLSHFQNKKASLISVTSFNLVSVSVLQQELFRDSTKKMIVADAMDRINNRYGEYTIGPALMLNMKNKIYDRIAFGRSAIGE